MAAHFAELRLSHEDLTGQVVELQTCLEDIVEMN